MRPPTASCNTPTRAASASTTPPPSTATAAPSSGWATCLAQQPRDEFVLATKVGRLIRPREAVGSGLDAAGAGQFLDAPPLVPVFDFSYDAVMRSFEESLERLGMDRIDVLHIHDPDDYFDQALERGVQGARQAPERGDDQGARVRHEPGRDAGPLRPRGRLRLLPGRRAVHPARPGGPPGAAADLRAEEASPSSSAASTTPASWRTWTIPSAPPSTTSRPSSAGSTRRARSRPSATATASRSRPPRSSSRWRTRPSPSS